jgi:hypothetical protein
MHGMLLVSNVLAHYAYFRLPALEGGESVGHFLHSYALFLQVLLELVISDFEPDDLKLVVILVILKHHASAQLIL